MNISNSKQFHIHPSLVVDDTVCVPIGGLYKQMVSVLRLHKGDEVRFFDGVGNIYEGAIAHINKDGILVPIRSKRNEPQGPELTLAVAIVKNDRMRWILEKATELGVTTIVPMITERVVKRPSEAPTRWKYIVKEAAEQSGRAWLPHIAEVSTLDSVVTKNKNVIMCAIGAVDLLSEIKVGDSPALLIGPEGGFTEGEIALAERHSAKLVSLCEHQLRADTAATVAIASIVNARCKDIL